MAQHASNSGKAAGASVSAAKKQPAGKSPRRGPTAKKIGGPVTPRSFATESPSQQSEGAGGPGVLGGPVVSRVFGGPVVSRVFGGPIVSRVFGGPIVSRDAAPPPAQFWGGPTVERDIAAREPGGTPAPKPLRVLCVHGVGDHHTNLDWADDWRHAIQNAVYTWNVNQSVTCDFLLYDDLFQNARLTPATYADALFKLGGSGLVAAGEAIADKAGQVVDDITAGIGSLFHPSRGLSDIPAELRWTAGMIAQWANDDDLREKARARVDQMIKKVDPDIILAHSLGTLICYDTFSRDQTLLGRGPNPQVDGRLFVAFGSQIGNPFVRGTFGGYIVALQKARRWYQLYNPNDRAFSAQIQPPPEPISAQVPAADASAATTEDVFSRVQTPFNDGFLNHDAVKYLTHPNASDGMWQEIVTRWGGPREFKPVTKSLGAFRHAARKASRRALLVGINEYPDPQNRLGGCLNDVFRVSAALQQRGFAPDEIRVVFDDRATAAGILDRLHWLLDGACPGDFRVFFYSGHGAQIPVYDPNGIVDHQAESLVPYDFDWTPERAITDNKFAELYSQLPYDSHLLTALDCCHAGGLGTGGTGSAPGAAATNSSSRSLGAAGAIGARVRGLVPPDDVRHRSIQWDAGTQMWIPRKLDPITADKSIAANPAYVGNSGSVYRFGRAVGLRRLDDAQKKAQRKANGNHDGPFVPLVLQACQESQLAYEYRDGVTSYGAFTFALTQVLRDLQGRKINYQDLTDAVNLRIREKLGYDQTPCLFGPREVIQGNVP